MTKEQERKSLSDIILEEWEKDSVIDRHNLGEESIKIPKLHAKYLRYLRQVNVSLIELKKRKKLLYKEKGLYFTGKAEPDEYRKKPFHLKVLKSDVDIYINADDDYSDITAKIEMCEFIIDGLKMIIGMIKDRQWQLRNTIEWDKFTNGS